MNPRGCDSDASVPGITAFRPGGAQSLAEPFDRVCHDQAGYVFETLVAELAGHTHAQRAAEGYLRIPEDLRHFGTLDRESYPTVRAAGRQLRRVFAPICFPIPALPSRPNAEPEVLQVGS